MGQFQEPDPDLSKLPTVSCKGTVVSRKGSTVSRQSSVASAISCQASSLKKATTAHIKSGHKAIVKTFKRAHQAISPRSLTPSNPDDNLPDLVDVESDGSDTSDNSEKRFGTCSFVWLILVLTHHAGPAKLKRSWRSSVYSFFKPKVTVEMYQGRPSHFFTCAAPRCKMKAGGIRRFQDSKDKSSTANLKYHATKCFGAEAVANAANGSDIKGQSSSIFTMFARPGQQPIRYSHRAHTNAETRYAMFLSSHTPSLSLFVLSAHIIKWVTESNRPANVMHDRELRELLSAGRPTIDLPSGQTVSRDIKACYSKCQARIDKLLQVCYTELLRCSLTLSKDHPGRLHFATDTWTSPNHRAFAAWTVHLEHNGRMFSFLLDIIEVPEVRYHACDIQCTLTQILQSHSGATLAKIFSAMLAQHGLSDKVCFSD